MTKINLLLTTIFCSVFLSYAALPEEEKEWNYSNEEIGYQVEKIEGKVYLHLDLNPDQYREIRIERSNNPVQYFRTIKYLGPQEVADLNADATIVDYYPLPGNIHAYYKVVTVDQIGVVKMYPCVKLDKKGF